MKDLMPEESAEHARLWGDYVRAVERHKSLFPAAVAAVSARKLGAVAVEDDYIHLVWEADQRLEASRQALERFRSAREIG